jgi:hypothetical protein
MDTEHGPPHRRNDGQSVKLEDLLLDFAFPRGWVWAQPQREVGWLHSLPYHPHQIVAQGVEVRLVPELGREGFQGLPRVVLPTVEAPIYERLYAPPQGSEQRRY